MFRQASLAPSPIRRFSMGCCFPSQQGSCLSGSSGSPGFSLFPKYTHLSPFAISRGVLEGVGTAVGCKCLLSLLEAVLEWRDISTDWLHCESFQYLSSVFSFTVLPWAVGGVLLFPLSLNMFLIPQPALFSYFAICLGKELQLFSVLSEKRLSCGTQVLRAGTSTRKAHLCHLMQGPGGECATRWTHAGPENTLTCYSWSCKDRQPKRGRSRKLYLGWANVLSWYL